MPDSVTSSFSEPDDFEAALRDDGCVGLLITGRGRFSAHLTHVALQTLRMSATEERVPRIALMAAPIDRVLIGFSIDGTPPVCGGMAMRSDEIITLSAGGQVHTRTGGPARWGSIWLPVDELIRYGGAVTGVPFDIPPAVRRWRPPLGARRGLRELHAAAIRTAARQPQALVNAEAARGLEQQLIYAAVECLTGDPEATSRAEGRHQDIMVRFDNLLRLEPEKDLRIAVICEQLDVSERLLRSLCADHLGIGPVHYNRLRRMWLTRRALRRSDPEASVSAIARQFGFRSPGRFAVGYRAAFGETPSITLRRGRDGVMNKTDLES
jgi:AraC-like DNA-binding protein